MNKLNVFAARYPEESENRLTWALMSLLRLAPMARVAFVDLVRAQQEEPIPALSEMLGCETRIDTQDSGIVAESGRLTAVGITSEGGEAGATIEPSPRRAIYDGILTFSLPERVVGGIPDQEPVTLTVETKLGASVNIEQLKPAESSLPPEEDGESPVQVDKVPVVLAWRDIFRTLADLDRRKLLSPSETSLVSDFLDFVHARHPELNPFDRFGLCRGNPGLLNRRCATILKGLEDIGPVMDGGAPHIGVTADTHKRIYLWCEGDDPGSIRLSLYPGANMAQARAFWPRVDTAKLETLSKQESWSVKPNLQFSRIQRHFYWAPSEDMTLGEYLTYWKDRHQEIRSCRRDAAGSFRHEWERLAREKLIAEQEIDELDEQTTPTGYRQISMSPGLRVEYQWPLKDAERLDRTGTFTEAVRERIREATETWGE